jgi:hypothetical protein
VTVILLAASILTATWSSRASSIKGHLFYVTLGCGILSLVGVIHSFAPLYRAWMLGAQRVQHLVVVLVFGSFYLLLGPVFFIIGKVHKLLTSRGASDDTFWVELQPESIDEESLRRMG